MENWKKSYSFFEFFKKESPRRDDSFFVPGTGSLFCRCYRCDMRVYTVVPVEEAFHVDDIADL